ncbi:MAG: hypothetical protein EHM21_03215 [Chloroflexi bacterium]|nr:MAG: hypothetical protein EHM21_03215 [Chloroflexota bacterium]
MKCVRGRRFRGSGAYAQGHIPGAVHLSLNSIVSTVDGVPFEFDQGEVQQALSQAGVRPKTTVVIYDDLGMMNAYPNLNPIRPPGCSVTRIRSSWIAPSP